MKPDRAWMVTLLAAAVVGSGAARAAEPVTAKDAEAMAKRGAAFIKANGKARAYAEITSLRGQFRDRDLYLVVYRLGATPQVQVAGETTAGRDLVDFRNIDSKEFAQRVEVARTRASLWRDDKFIHPTSRKIDASTMYCERLDDTAVCSGTYRH